MPDGHEVVIGGWNSNGAAFRSVVGGVYRGDHLVYVGNVGTGYGDYKVSRLMPKLKAQASEANPFGGKDAPRKKAGMHWLRPVLVAEIEFAGWTGSGMIGACPLAKKLLHSARDGMSTLSDFMKVARSALRESSYRKSA